jgi:hypothetical protein
MSLAISNCGVMIPLALYAGLSTKKYFTCIVVGDSMIRFELLVQVLLSDIC